MSEGDLTDDNEEMGVDNERDGHKHQHDNDTTMNDDEMMVDDERNGHKEWRKGISFPYKWLRFRFNFFPFWTCEIAANLRFGTVLPVSHLILPILVWKRVCFRVDSESMSRT